MTLAWQCAADAGHGPFLQAGLDALADLHPELQPRGRFGCPVCVAKGLAGWLRPASKTEAARFAVNKEN